MMKDIPLAKFYEAYTALADHRVKPIDGHAYEVTSSDGTKVYTVKVDGTVYSSNDNATYWQHYASYPVIAVLAIQGKFQPDASLYPYLSHIPWKTLNQKAKNHYDIAIQEALIDLPADIQDRIQARMNQDKAAVMAMDLTIKGNRVKLK